MLEQLADRLPEFGYEVWWSDDDLEGRQLLGFFIQTGRQRYRLKKYCDFVAMDSLFDTNTRASLTVCLWCDPVV